MTTNTNESESKFRTRAEAEAEIASINKEIERLFAATPAPEASPNPDSRSLPAVPKRSGMHGRPRAAEVHAIFTDNQARSVIGRAVVERGGKEIWALILLAIDHGFLTKTDICINQLTERILFPAAPKKWREKFNLADAKSRVYVPDVIMPAAIANRDAILAAPERIEEILAAHARREATAVRAADEKRKSAAAMQRLPSTECEVILFGERLWPRADNATYDFDQLRAAVWYFRDLNNWLSGSRDGASVGSRALILRLTTKWFNEYVQRAIESSRDQARITRIFTLIGQLTRLLERNPDGECKWPPTPTAEGQW